MCDMCKVNMYEVNMCEVLWLDRVENKKRRKKETTKLNMYR